MTKERISRKRFFGVVGVAVLGAACGRIPALTEVPSEIPSPVKTPGVTPTEVVTEPTVLDLLSKDFYMKNATSLWYTNPTSDKSVPVLVDLNSTEATFQYALEGGKNTNGPEGGRETVRYVNYDHLYAFSESDLVGVSNWDHRVFTFDTRSMSWREKLGSEAVADYVDNSDGSRTIMVWWKDAGGQMVEVDSGYRIDSSDALIKASNLSSK
jgi:hypothetical protein